MGSRLRLGRRACATTALAAAVALVGATAANAHHCYKDVWADAAYAHHLAGGTPWTPLSDMGAMFIIGPGSPQCHHVADDAVADFMAARGLTQEPLIHSKATTGGGAAHQGKDVKPFSYLGEADFTELTISVIAGMATCDPTWELPGE